jgi:hypothetical protein
VHAKCTFCGAKIRDP